MMKEPMELLKELTLEEKASLLSGDDFWHTKAVERLGIPRVMVSDGPHGLRKQDDKADHLGVNESIKAVCFPAGCALAASFDRSLMRKMGEAIGDECQHEQVAVDLGPAINIKRSPLCGRNFEYFSEDPYLTGELSAELVRGIQSRDVGTSVKHFALNSQEHRRMSSDSVADERTLREIYLPAFETVVKKAAPWTIMCSYNKVNGEFASQNKRLLTDILRDEWGFKGLVMSDWGAVSDRVKGVQAGLDLEMPASGGVNDREIVRAVREGRLDEKDVDRCCLRVLEMVKRFTDNARKETPWDMEAHHALSGSIAEECMVLLKNEDGILPLKKGEKIALIGEMAEKPRFQGGGSSHINSFRVTSLRDAMGGEENVTYVPGYRGTGEDAGLLEEAAKAAAAADKAVVVAGLPDSFESEGYDRTHLSIPENQVRLIAAVAEANPNTVVLLYNGSPVEMPWLGQVKGVVEGYLGGQDLGDAGKRILYGEANPSGRLPESFPMRLEDTSCYLTYGGEGNRAVYSEGIFVGYRCYNTRKTPLLFPFGYGLSYTSFEVADLRVSADRIRDDGTLKVQVDVKNTGNLDGKETVQLYVAPPTCGVFRPVRELKEFEKVFLRAGEKKTVEFTLDKRSFARWNEEINNWYTDSGEYRVQICRNAEEVLLEAKVTVENTQTVPVTFDEDSIMMDIAACPAAAQVVMASMRRPEWESEEEGSAASEAVTAEMSSAMMRYMPLRGQISFSGGQVTHEDLKKLIEKMNAAAKENGDRK
ncbi:MAG: glycoside hydrolase family 3 C-terminal domain-containing protein [Clostridia bacterium]|nr:glycoside hydrolase family 3 C-terminal domain-containing protein [Clostridia bacterium]